ncbi:MAG: hypothetical protein GVY05_05780, partial [Bacteroidetes bacterium]|nr:hypothetical protein [Bacteroidota bacterium]
KLLGGLFGLLKFGLLLSILLLLFNVINEQVEVISQQTLDKSYTYPILNQFTDVIWPKLVEMSQEQKDLIDNIPH